MEQPTPQEVFRLRSTTGIVVVYTGGHRVTPWKDALGAVHRQIRAEAFLHAYRPGDEANPRKHYTVRFPEDFLQPWLADEHTARRKGKGCWAWCLPRVRAFARQVLALYRPDAAVVSGGRVVGVPRGRRWKAETWMPLEGDR